MAYCATDTWRFGAEVAGVLLTIVVLLGFLNASVNTAMATRVTSPASPAMHDGDLPLVTTLESLEDQLRPICEQLLTRPSRWRDVPNPA
jgi:hypothetical protein